MTSMWLMKLLLCEYLGLMVFALLDGRNVLALYWLGALLLNIAVFFFAIKS